VSFAVPSRGDFSVGLIEWRRKTCPLVASLKTLPPVNVLTKRLSAYIRGFAEVLFSEDEVERFERRLRDIKTHTLYTRTTHVRSLKERHTSTKECPKCGEALVERTARSVRNVGGKFLGCSAFPKCRYTRTP
jgi:restriction system protein